MHALVVHSHASAAFGSLCRFWPQTHTVTDIPPSQESETLAISNKAARARRSLVAIDGLASSRENPSDDADGPTRPAGGARMKDGGGAAAAGVGGRPRPRDPDVRPLRNVHTSGDPTCSAARAGCYFFTKLMFTYVSSSMFSEINFYLTVEICCNTEFRMPPFPRSQPDRV
jgi:hypothetical protein